MASSKRAAVALRPLAPAPVKRQGKRLSGLSKLLIALVALWVLAGGALLGLMQWRQTSTPSMIPPHVQAPAVALADQTGRVHQLDDYAKRSVILIFVPNLGAETEAELVSVTKEISRFDTLGVKLFAVAPVAAAEAQAFHTRLQLPFPMLCDEGGRVAHTFGVAPGRPRLSYLIGPKREVLLPLATVHPADHGPQLLELSECCLDTSPAAPNPLLGKPVPEFTLPIAGSDKVRTLYGERTQKATVVLFLSARCPCSGKYDARNRELARVYGAQGVRFLAVNGSQDEPATEVAAHAAKVGFPFPVLKDTTGKVVDAFGAQVTPEVYVLDARGVLRYHGRIDDSRDGKNIQHHDLRNTLDLLLARNTSDLPETRAFGCAIARHTKEGGA